MIWDGSTVLLPLIRRHALHPTAAMQPLCPNEMGILLSLLTLPLLSWLRSSARSTTTSLKIVLAISHVEVHAHATTRAAASLTVVPALATALLVTLLLISIPSAVILTILAVARALLLVGGTAAMLIHEVWLVESVVLEEHGYSIVGVSLVTVPLVESYENTVRDGRWLHPRMCHLRKEADAGRKIICFHATVHERVVDKLVALQPARLESLRNLQRLIEVADVTVALEEGREGDQVRLKTTPRRHHLPHVILGCLHVVALDAYIDD
mmetsp:Transcript_116250/g.260007  ORF Transcript_116250/g.260007 Transcript_116250/m.260007 type:complete len:267 (+) Transcript_116250:128-928(+)